MPFVKLAILTLLGLCSNLTMASPMPQEPMALVPQPTSVEVKQDAQFLLPGIIRATVHTNGAENELWQQHLAVFGTHLERLTNGRQRLENTQLDPNRIAAATLAIKYDKNLATEAYTLKINDSQIQLSAKSVKGLSHGTATLLQLIGGRKSALSLPQLTIHDQPSLSYRNFMVDMGRNPHSVHLLKETIDMLWFYKIDSLHLHLTDDQRIAFPSKAFPKIWDGIITWDQLKDLESYARVRGVTLIPELEVPGHSGLLRSRYPETFGKTATDLAKAPKALAGIKTLLDEMMEVFSSPYIHIGGDEAFGVPEELQRDLINELHAYLKSKGRQTLVWEGPRAGMGTNKVNSEVIHINWRTINYPADEMLKDGHRVVNAAWDPLYIVDHYPRTNFTMTTPEHIYTTLSLTRFKHVNPGIRTFANPIEVEPNDKLIGFCMPWWEGREENFIPLNFPRLIPFAEVAWNPAIERDFKNLSARSTATERVRLAAFYPVRIETSTIATTNDGKTQFSPTAKLSTSSMFANMSGGEVHFTTNGTQPSVASPRYTQEIKLQKTGQIRAALFKNTKQIGHESRVKLTAIRAQPNLALGKPVTSSATSSEPFNIERITDGGTGNLDFYLGYPAIPQPISITIDLKNIHTVGQINVFAYSVSGSYEKYEVQTSKDGKNFTQVATRLEKPDQPTPEEIHQFEPQDARYVRIVSYGNRGYVFDSFSKVIEVQVFPPSKQAGTKDDNDVTSKPLR